MYGSTRCPCVWCVTVNETGRDGRNSGVILHYIKDVHYFSDPDLTKLMVVGGVDLNTQERLDETEIVDVSGLGLQCSTPGVYPFKVLVYCYFIQLLKLKLWLCKMLFVILYGRTRV